MRYQELILEKTEKIEGEIYRLIIDSMFDDEACSIDFAARVLWDDRPVAVVSLRATVNNPLDVSGMLLFAGGVYGVCVAGGLIGAVGKTAFQSYEASKKDSPKASRSEKAKMVWEGVVARKTDLKGEAVKSLTGCMTKFFGP